MLKYEFITAEPITEAEALAQVAAMGFHGYAFDQVTPVDEELHWHEFESISWVISGTGRFADGNGTVFEVAPGCRLKAPAGWLHRNLAGPSVRIVIGTNLPFEQWSKPIDKDPAERPASLAA